MPGVIGDVTLYNLLTWGLSRPVARAPACGVSSDMSILVAFWGTFNSSITLGSWASGAA